MAATGRQARWHGRVEQAAPQPCGHGGCTSPAEFRAPRSNRATGSDGGWQWLCLEHVRAFNSRYNYFDGMSAEAIAAAQSPLAEAHATKPDPLAGASDRLGILGMRFGARAATQVSNAPAADPRDLAALKTLGLAPEATNAEIRRAYARLARMSHPDSNNGDRAGEAKLADVLAAYDRLRKRDRT